MKAGFLTLGCKVNQYETQAMMENLQKSGYTICDKNDSPDIFIINSCTVTSESDRKTRQLLRRYRRLLPDSVIVLTGCVPQAFPEKTDELNEADIVLGNASNHLLVPAIEEFLTSHARCVKVLEHTKDEKFANTTVTDFHERTRAYIKIEDGCNRFCSYCIIPYARGRVRSKPIDDIAREADMLSRAGHKEIVLVGINLSAYGTDIGSNLCDAVDAAAAPSGISRVRLGSLEPDTLTPQMIDRLAAQPKLCPQFHLSLQSGCDETLSRMNRHYTTDYYYSLVTCLRGRFDNCSVTTDIMVGFAGETDEEFEKSLEFAKKVGFAKAHVFAYSVRPGTRAASFDGQVSKSVKEIRSKKMIDATVQSQIEFLQNCCGKSFPVLFEQRNSDGLLEGYTENYTHVLVNSSEDLHGEIRNVKIIRVSGQSCIGEII